MPESAGRKRGQAGAEARLLSPGGDAQIDIVSQPMVGVLVPAAQISVGVLRGLKTPGIDILQPVPEDLAGLGIEAIVSHARQDTSTFRQGPDAVVLEACG